MTLLSAWFSPVRSHFGRAVAWLPWLIVALLVTWLLWAEWTTPSQLLYQSPPLSPPVTPPPPTDTPVPPPPADTPVPLPTDTPLLPTETTVPSPTVEAPIEVPTPTNTLTTEAPTPAIATATPTPVTLVPAPSVDAQESGGTGESVINWTKFWDTVMVAVAYPWLCCGIALLLLVPVGLIYLEIKGRRRPPKLPEPLRGKAGKDNLKEPNRPDA